MAKNTKKFTSSVSSPKKISVKKNSFRDKLRYDNKLDEEELLRNHNKKEYKENLLSSIEDIDFLVSNILNRNDFIIDKSYNAFTLKKSVINDNIMSSKSINYIISIEIGIDTINLTCEHNNNDNYYESLTMLDDTLYTKWYDELQKSYYQHLNKKCKSIFNNICDLTKLSRKNKINKMIK